MEERIRGLGNSLQFPTIQQSETLTRRACLQLEPSRSSSPNHQNGTREATVLCRAVLIAHGKHVRKTASFRISWAQGKNYSMWEALT